MFLLAYGRAAVSIEVTPNIGNSARGKREVTGIGIASVAHQQTISIAIAATVQAVSFKPDGAGSSKINKNIAIPIQKPLFFIAIF